MKSKIAATNKAAASKGTAFSLQESLGNIEGVPSKPLKPTWELYTCYCWARWLRIYYKHTRKSISSQFKLLFSRQVSRIRLNHFQLMPILPILQAQVSEACMVCLLDVAGSSLGRSLTTTSSSWMFRDVLAKKLCEAGRWSQKKLHLSCPESARSKTHPSNLGFEDPRLRTAPSRTTSWFDDIAWAMLCKNSCKSTCLCLYVCT